MVDAVTRFACELEGVRREVRAVRRAVVCGEMRQRPWERVSSPARGRLVYAAHLYLQSNPDADVVDVCRAVWRALPGGYPNRAAFTTYCYSVRDELMLP